MRTRQLLVFISVFLVFISLLSTGLGGWVDMTGRPFVISREHAWNDGVYAVLVAIFLVLLAPLV